MTTRYAHIGSPDESMEFEDVFRIEESMESTTEKYTEAAAALGTQLGVTGEKSAEFAATLEKFEERLKGAEFWRRYRLWGKLVAEGKKHSYEGMVPRKVIDKRRAANKVAKASRKRNR